MSVSRKPKGYSDLIVAVWRDETDRVDQLLQKGADPNARDTDGRTPLMHAVLRNRLAILKLLSQRGAEVNLQDNGGFSALHFAAQNYELAAAEELLRAGAQMELKDSFGNTPLWRAVTDSRGRGELITLLLRHGADRFAKNNSAKTPVDLANVIANYDLKQFFLEKSAE
jgi:ankyrin repeat protein